MKQKFTGVFPFEFDEPAAGLATTIPTEVHLIPIGKWEHDQYGTITITKADIEQFASNFDAKIRKGVPITAGHEGFEELPAVGWITRVEARDTGLWGSVEWNEQGKALLSDRAFKFFSPEFYREYEDPQTHQIFKNVIVGGALTKSPYFKELEAVVFSEPNIKRKFNEQDNTMDLTTILAKDITTLDDAEKAFIKEHSAELTDEQKASHAAVIEEPSETEETPEEKTAREAKETADKAASDAAAAAAAAGGEGDGTVVAGSEKVQISASELKILRDKADQGQQAFAEMQKQKTEAEVTKHLFSDSNKTGKFLPKSKDTLRSFMESLNDAQRVKFSTLMSEIPKSNLFSEAGSGSGLTEGTSQATVEIKVKQKMSENKDMKYSEALKLVMSENEGLEESYDRELVPVRA